MCIETFLQNISSFIEYINTKLNSPLGESAIGSFFGAVGGYIMVWANNNRTEILSRIDHLKMALSLTYSLFNAFLSLKKQHIKGLYEKYEEGRKIFIEAKKNNGTLSIPFHFQSISFPYVDFNHVNTSLFEKTNLVGRAFILGTTLVRTMYELKNQMISRHHIINEIQELAAKYDLNAHDTACLYYGVKMKNGHLGDILYANYSDVMSNIASLADDCIWFSKELTEEITQVGKRVSKKLFFSRPKMGNIDYSDIDKDLMPNDLNYKDWREKFQKA